MFRISCLCLLLLSCGQAVQKVKSIQRTSVIPVLHVKTDTGSFELAISELHIDVQVSGNIATTVFDIRFKNDLDRDLEGEFDFPLADGQNISRYALEINGKLREGVVVEKKTARIAYENTIRQKIDPGLVEKTQGSNFRTRIYPIPANGSKRVVIGIEESLEYRDEAYRYLLPLHTNTVFDKFSLQVNVSGSQKPQTQENELVPFEFVKSNGSFSGEATHENFMANHLFAFSLPFEEEDKPIVLTEVYEGKTYFYINSIISTEETKKDEPSVLGILWDISSSSLKRNTDKDKQLLLQYLSQLENIQVLLIPFHIAAQEPEQFHIRDANPLGLLQRLDAFPIDGGTQLGALDLRKYEVDEFLFFSDGISTFGLEEMILSDKPVYPINSSPSADYGYLRFIAQETGGKLIDLVKRDAKAGVLQLQNEILNIPSSDKIYEQAEDLVIHLDPVNRTISIAGKMKSDPSSLRMHFEKNGALFLDEEFDLRSGMNVSDKVNRIWASMMIRELEMQHEKNRERITELGKKFSIVTQNTSLLVLDRVEDYVEYGIAPPEELRKEYYALLKEKTNLKTNEKEIAFNEALSEMDAMKEWWKSGPRKKQNNPIEIQEISGVPDGLILTLDTTITSPGLNYSTPRSEGAPPAPQASRRVEDIKFTAPIIRSDEAVGSNESGPRRNYERANAGDLIEYQSTSTHSGADEVSDSFDSVSTVPFTGSSAIDIKEWSADAAYLKTLNKAAPASRYKTYLELKKANGDQPSFYIDVARLFLSQNDVPDALLVLSNVAELKLESAELLRIMALQLLEMKEYELAIETFIKIRKLREEDPHSSRDLALAYAESGSYNKAVTLLYDVATGVWPDRFGNIRSIALNELNALIAAHTNEVDLTSIDPRLIFPMPLDVRIVIGWTSDNSDIDLWVTDPHKEKCFYEHNETASGGKISQDVTQGYGPEEFCIRNALKGIYVVEANLFGDNRQTIGGPITIIAELFTDFGKPSQKRSTIHFRVSDQKEVVKIGELRFGK